MAEGYVKRTGVDAAPSVKLPTRQDNDERGDPDEDRLAQTSGPFSRMDDGLAVVLRRSGFGGRIRVASMGGFGYQSGSVLKRSQR